MGVTIRLLKIIAVVGVVGLTIGFIYFAFFRPAEAPQPKVVAELAKTQYQVGEEISVKPYLINMGKRPITVFSGVPLLFAKVYDAEKREVTPVTTPKLLILAPYTLKPQMPYYNEDDRWPGLLEAYTFTLDQPGRYKVVAWTEFSLDKDYAYPLHIYADPIWIEVVTGSN